MSKEEGAELASKTEAMFLEVSAVSGENCERLLEWPAQSIVKDMEEKRLKVTKEVLMLLKKVDLGVRLGDRRHSFAASQTEIEITSQP